MGQRIVIDPVTRIEGHAKISLILDDQGEVSDARFHVVEFRGFEKFCEGRSFREMPGITSRVCGICPVSHMLTSAKAGDELLAVEIPEGATRLRRLVHYGQILQSHALSFFHLSSPDFLLGHDSDPAKRNVMGLIAANPEVARRGIRLRQFGQEVIETLAGKKIHSTWVVPGGVDEPLTEEGRGRIRKWLPESKEAILKTLTFWKREMDRHQDEARVFGNFPSLFMGLVGPEGELAHTFGKLRFVDETGRVVADQIEPEDYQRWIGEAVEPWSYLKFPYFKPLGYPQGLYRVGPLARLNVATAMATPLAEAERQRLFETLGWPAHQTLAFHWARLVEALQAAESVAARAEDPLLESRDVRTVPARPDGPREGVGIVEAPRGTLIHHYVADAEGLLTQVNLVVASQHNAAPVQISVRKAARGLIRGGKVDDGLLNRLEMAFRAYDPCNACASHAAPGELPLVVTVRDHRGQVVEVVRRRVDEDEG